MGEELGLYVGCSKSRGFFNYVTRYLGGYDWSHSFVLFKDGPLEEAILIEADKNKVFRGTLHSRKYFKEGLEWELFKITDAEDVENCLKYLEEKVGSPYNFLQYIGMLPIAILNRLGINAKRLPNFFGWISFICSEISFLALRKTLPLGKARTELLKYYRNSIAPDHIYDILNKYYDVSYKFKDNVLTKGE